MDDAASAGKSDYFLEDSASRGLIIPTEEIWRGSLHLECSSSRFLYRWSTQSIENLLSVGEYVDNNLMCAKEYPSCKGNRLTGSP